MSDLPKGLLGRPAWETWETGGRCQCLALTGPRGWITVTDAYGSTVPEPGEPILVNVYSAADGDEQPVASFRFSSLDALEAAGLKIDMGPPTQAQRETAERIADAILDSAAAEWLTENRTLEGVYRYAENAMGMCIDETTAKLTVELIDGESP